MGSSLKEIVVIGGTGAQGIPVVKALSESGRYSVRVMTRDVNSKRAKDLAALPNVHLVTGTQDSQKDLHVAFKGAYGAWINFDGFTLGEMKEYFYGTRAYEIARHEKVQHYIWANTDYAVKKSNWDEEYHWGHNDAKGRIGDLILSHGQEGMKTSCFTTGPYMNMLLDGMFEPLIEDDGTVVWWNPAGNGKIPLIALEDVGFYVLWMFDNVERSAGIDLEVATDQVSFSDIASTFTHVTGKRGIHRFTPFEEYMEKKEPYPDAPANWSPGPGRPREESQMSWKENFTAWWKFWGSGRGADRDMKLMDEIHPNRIKNLEDWMRKVDYQGLPRPVLKDREDLMAKAQAMRTSKV